LNFSLKKKADIFLIGFSRSKILAGTQECVKILKKLTHPWKSEIRSTKFETNSIDGNWYQVGVEMGGKRGYN